MSAHFIEYVGFWRRAIALLLDSLLFGLLSAILLYAIYGRQYYVWLFANLSNDEQYFSSLQLLMDYALPVAITVIMWVKFRGTPGKLLLNCVVVDFKSHRKISTLQALIRYFSYIISALPMGLGFLWIAWDPNKQGFHDKIARTVVIFEDEADKSLAELSQELC